MQSLRCGADTAPRVGAWAVGGEVTEIGDAAREANPDAAGVDHEQSGECGVLVAPGRVGYCSGSANCGHLVGAAVASHETAVTVAECPSTHVARQVSCSADPRCRFVCPGWVRTGDRARQGGDLGGECAGIGEVFERQVVESAAEVSEGSESVEETRGEGVAGANCVNDHGRRGRDSDARAVQ